VKNSGLGKNFSKKTIDIVLNIKKRTAEIEKLSQKKLTADS